MHKVSVDFKQQGYGEALICTEALALVKGRVNFPPSVSCLVKNVPLVLLHLSAFSSPNEHKVVYVALPFYSHMPL